MVETKRVNLGGWEVSWPAGEGESRHGLVDLIPLEDLKDHQYGKDCWCKPVDDEGVWVHNSADGREKVEEGQAARN